MKPLFLNSVIIAHDKSHTHTTTTTAAAAAAAAAATSNSHMFFRPAPKSSRHYIMSERAVV